MESTTENQLARIDERLANLSETARTLSVEAGANSESDLGSRVGTLQAALEAVRSDVQGLREELGE
jgi:hypothetical protein